MSDSVPLKVVRPNQEVPCLDPAISPFPVKVKEEVMTEIEDRLPESVEGIRPESSPSRIVPNSDTVEEDFPYLTGKPYFQIILAKTHLHRNYQLIFPKKFASLLPRATVPAVLRCRGKSWNMACVECRRYHRFDTNWRTFAIDNDLKVGDGCFFELMECSSKFIKFNVHIVSGDFPTELLPSDSGSSPDSPILII